MFKRRRMHRTARPPSLPSPTSGEGFIARALAAALLLIGAPASAQDARVANNYPSHTIRMIVPFPPGGPADTIARIVGAKMSEHWGQPVVIENRAGGNTAIGAELVAKSAPDGYTLLIAMDVTMVMNPLVMTNLPYDPQKDFAPVTLLTKNISLITTRSDGPKTMAELIAKAKANPGKLNVGAGTITSRLGALAFAQAAGIDVTLVPYKGSSDITQGLLTGAVDFAQDSVSNALPLIEAGKFRALAKYSNRPLPLLPDVPSLSVAAGLPDIRRKRDLDRRRRASRHAEAGDRQGPARNRRHLRRSGDGGAAGKGRAERRVEHAGRARCLHPQRERALGQADQERHCR